MLDLGLRLAMCAGLAAALGGAVLAFGHHERDVGRAEVRAEWQSDKVVQQAAVINEQVANAAETSRRLKAQQGVLDGLSDQLATARADAHAAGAERDRLRKQQASYLAAADAHDTAGYSATAGRCEATVAAADLFADLFSESDEGAGVLAAALDSARAAGLACERAYNALTNTSPQQPKE